MPRRSHNVDTNRPVRRSRRSELLDNLSHRAQRAQVRQAHEPEPKESNTNELQQRLLIKKNNKDCNVKAKVSTQ